MYEPAVQAKLLLVLKVLIAVIPGMESGRQLPIETGRMAEPS